jgi:hypothetical protein
MAFVDPFFDRRPAKMNALNDELVNRLKVSALDFLLNQLLCFRFDVDRLTATQGAGA